MQSLPAGVLRCSSNCTFSLAGCVSGTGGMPGVGGVSGVGGMVNV
jgi:hypothetical protein